MVTLRPVLYVIGLLLLFLGFAMMVPAFADVASHDSGWQQFAASSGVTLFVGGSLVLTNWSSQFALTLRQGFILTTCSWIAISAFAALPLVFGSLELSYTDAFFEVISGLTTTGSTVLVGLDYMSPSILLWRAMLQWLGGIGIIVMAVAMLPFLSVGGMQLFRTESSDRSDKALPRAGQIAASTVAAYLVLSLLCGFAYYLDGMTAFEAVVHAMTTLSTGGFSTSDQSLGHFSSRLIDWTCALFMLLGALPFVLYIRSVRGDRGALFNNSQVRSFIWVIAIVTLIITALLWLDDGLPLFDALTQAAFNVISIVTTTGFATADYGTWGPGAVALIFVLICIGGCTGSTSGGLKIFRFEIMLRSTVKQLRSLLYPHGIFQTTYMGKPFGDEVRTSVMVFASLFVASVTLLALALAATGVDFATSISGAATAIANVGPGIGPVIGPAGNFAPLPDAAKWALCAGMLFGRLEIFTVLVLLTPHFWAS